MTTHLPNEGIFFNAKKSFTFSASCSLPRLRGFELTFAADPLIR